MTLVLPVLAQAIEVPEIFRSLGVAGGVLVFLFVTEVVVAGAVAKRWEARYDKVREQLAAKDRYLVEEIVPLLTEAVRVIGQRADQGRDG